MARRHEEKYRSVLGQIKKRFGGTVTGELEKYVDRANSYITKATTANYDQDKVKGLEALAAVYSQGFLNMTSGMNDPSDVHFLADKYSHLIDAGIDPSLPTVRFGTESANRPNEMTLNIISGSDQLDMVIGSYEFALYSGITQPMDWMDIKFDKYMAKKKIIKNGHGPYQQQERRIIRIKVNI
ncbi:MAG: hypothetical protein V1729_02425 [Candidatus Woesearchaeota archaeon]